MTLGFKVKRWPRTMTEKREPEFNYLREYFLSFFRGKLPSLLNNQMEGNFHERRGSQSPYSHKIPCALEDVSLSISVTPLETDRGWVRGLPHYPKFLMEVLSKETFHQGFIQ